MTTHQAVPLPFPHRPHRPVCERRGPGRGAVTLVVAVALACVSFGGVQAMLAGRDASSRDDLVRTVQRACVQDRAPSDVCAAGERAVR